MLILRIRIEDSGVACHTQLGDIAYMSLLPEPWLRGPIQGVHPLLTPILYTFQQAREDLAKHTGPLTASQIWATPHGFGSVGFHIRHIAGSTGRLMTYLEGRELNAEQMSRLQAEEQSGVQGRDELLSELDRAFVRAEAQVRALKPETLAEARAVGRKHLPTTVIGLLMHIAEHIQRHVGQAVSAAKLASAGAGRIDQFFESNGVRIRYVEEGSGEPVVLIHGFTQNADRGWIDTGVFQELAKRYRTIALDCRGHGKSGKPHDPKQYGWEMARDAVRLLDHLGIPKAHMAGYSMGGGIVIRLLTLAPERFLTATLGGIAAGLSGVHLEPWAAEIERGSMRSLILALSPDNRPQPTEEQIRQTSATFLAGNDRVALASLLRSPDRMVTQDDLTPVQVPVLGVSGTEDPALQGLNGLKPLMAQLTVVAIEGAAHGDAFARPEFLQAIQQFLAAHPSAHR